MQEDILIEKVRPVALLINQTVICVAPFVQFWQFKVLLQVIDNKWNSKTISD